MKCAECTGTYARKKTSYTFMGHYIGDYDKLICNKCGDTVIEGSVVAETEKELKRRGLWGLRSKQVLTEGHLR